MSFKLNFINSQLALTGNNLVNIADDGSPEWTVGSAAYEDALRYLLGGHDWKFGTDIRALSRVGVSPDTRYSDAFAKPHGALGLTWVRVGGHDTDWRIVGDRVLVNATEATAKIVLEPAPEAYPPMFLEALACRLKAGLYSGLNDEPDEARNLREESEGYLALARTRSDRGEAARKTFRSHILARRRRRR